MAISAEDFANAFKKVSEAFLLEMDPAELLRLYIDNKSWTEVMLGKDGFITKLHNKLNKGNADLAFEKFYRLDAIICSKEKFWETAESPKWYPSRIYVAIEHENGGYPQSEMWKLAFVRADLKVLITYEDPKKSGWVGTIQTEPADTVWVLDIPAPPHCRTSY